METGSAAIPSQHVLLMHGDEFPTNRILGNSVHLTLWPLTLFIEQDERIFSQYSSQSWKVPLKH
jgi:hypothetical protein